MTTSTPTAKDTPVTTTVAQSATADVIVDLARRATLRRQAESQTQKTYSKTSLMLLRILDANFKMAPSKRQIDKSTVNRDEFCNNEATKQEMLTSLREVLGDASRAVFRCPHTHELGANSECLAKSYSYMDLVHHMMFSHRCKFGYLKESRGRSLKVTHLNLRYGCASCQFDTANVVPMLEHVRHHCSGVPPYQCLTCKKHFFAYEASDHKEVLTYYVCQCV